MIKLRCTLVGLLVLAGLTFLSLLVVGGGEGPARAQETSLLGRVSGGLPRRTVSLPQSSLLYFDRRVPAIISNTFSPNSVHSPFVAREGAANAPDDVGAQALLFDIELRAVPIEVDSLNDLEYIIRYAVNNAADHCPGL